MSGIATAHLNRNFNTVKHHLMSSEWIALLAGIAGAALAALGSYFKAKFSSSTTNEIDFRQTILKRIEHLERRAQKLEHTIEEWTSRYWSLYVWIVNFCIEQNIEARPPNFHQMSKEDIKDKLDKTEAKGMGDIVDNQNKNI